MLRIAVIGATGVVGRECLSLLDSSDLPIEAVTPVATERNAGRDLRGELGLSLQMSPVTSVDSLTAEGLDVAIFCAGREVSEKVARPLAESGVLVVDNTSAFRMEEGVPLVVPQVNPEAIARRPESHIIANPNCSTIQLVRALHPLQQLAGLSRVVVSTYQAASGGGTGGLEELREASLRALSEPGGPVEEPRHFGRPLSFNLIPEIGMQDEDGFSHEERKLAREPRKILGLPELRVSATAVRVPVFHCHSEAVHVQLDQPVTRDMLEDALKSAPGIRLYPHSPEAATDYPMPRMVFGGVNGTDDRAMVHVGRIRVEADDPKTVALWVVADNLWVGAALNAVQIVECAVRHGWLR